MRSGTSRMSQFMVTIPAVVTCHIPVAAVAIVAGETPISTELVPEVSRCLMELLCGVAIVITTGTKLT